MTTYPPLLVYISIECPLGLSSFWKLVDDFIEKGAIDTRKLTVEAQVLLYLTKLRLGDANERLGHIFNG